MYVNVPIAGIGSKEEERENLNAKVRDYLDGGGLITLLPSRRKMSIKKGLLEQHAFRIRK